MAPVCNIKTEAGDRQLAMEWREAVYSQGGKMKPFWVVVSDDPFIDEVINLCAIKGQRRGVFSKPGSATKIHWRIEGAPSLPPERTL